eukprot:2063280-Amphidinium_carterae.1
MVREIPSTHETCGGATWSSDVGAKAHKHQFVLQTHLQANQRVMRKKIADSAMKKRHWRQGWNPSNAGLRLSGSISASRTKSQTKEAAEMSRMEQNS